MNSGQCGSIYWTVFSSQAICFRVRSIGYFGALWGTYLLNMVWHYCVTVPVSGRVKTGCWCLCVADDCGHWKLFLFVVFHVAIRWSTSRSCSASRGQPWLSEWLKTRKIWVNGWRIFGFLWNWSNLDLCTGLFLYPGILLLCVNFGTNPSLF